MSSIRRGGLILAAVASGLAALLVMLGPAPARAAASASPHGLPVGSASWYAIRWNRHLVGYSHYTVERTVSLAGKQFYVINADSRIKLGAGPLNDARFKAKLLLDFGTLKPSFFLCRQAQGSGAVDLECLFTDDLIAEKTRNGKDETVTNVNVSGPTYLLFNNVWGRFDTFADHYVVLLTRWLAGGAPTGLPVFDPVLKGTSTIRFVALPAETVAVGGRSIRARRYNLLNPQGEVMLSAWVAPDTDQILRLAEPGGFAFSLSDHQVAELVDRTPGIDLYRNRTQLSSVYFPNADKLRDFKAEVDVQLQGNPQMVRHAVAYDQTFQGVAESGHVKGTVEVATREAQVADSDDYPHQGSYGGDLAPYTKPGPGLESDLDEMLSQGQQAAWKSRTTWEAAQRISTWVHDKIATGYSLPSARYALDHMIGNSESKALLAAALMRAVGIPARIVSGLRFSDGDFIPHHWVEVWVGKDGWAPLDPTTGEAGTLSADHLALSGGGEVTDVNVKVLSYAPTPPPQVAFFHRELAWPVGQERTYSVIHGGKQIGTETAHVVGLVRVNGLDAYQMTFSSDVETAQGHLTASAQLVTTPDVLPLQYHVTVTQTPRDAPGKTAAPQSDTRSITFQNREAQEAIPGSGPDRTQETPISDGVYLADHRFMTLYALVVGQVPNLAAGEKTSVYLYRPDTHETDEVKLQVQQEEKLSVNGEERDVWHLESSDGMTFFLDKQSGQVVRIEYPHQDLVLQLLTSKVKI